jgi:hypothetical protein
VSDKTISALDAATTPLAGTEVLPIVQSSTTKKVTIANVTAGRDVSAKSLTAESNGVGSQSEVIARNTAGGERIHLLSRSETGVSYAQSQNSILLVGTYDNFNVQIRTNNTQRMLFDTSGNVTVSNGNLVVGTAGKGIDFSANSNAAGMTSELLSWYEEGTWTPVIEGSSSAGTATYSAQSARYTRIGRLVFFEAYVSWNTGSGTGSLRLAGLPFTIANANTYPSFTLGYVFNIALTASNYMTAYGNVNSTSVVFSQTPVGGGAATDVPYDGTGAIQISGCYTV